MWASIFFSVSPPFYLVSFSLPPKKKLVLFIFSSRLIGFTPIKGDCHLSFCCDLKRHMITDGSCFYNWAAISFLFVL